MFSLFSEHRLLSITSSTLNAQRVAGGATPVYGRPDPRAVSSSLASSPMNTVNSVQVQNYAPNSSGGYTALTPQQNFGQNVGETPEKLVGAGVITPMQGMVQSLGDKLNSAEGNVKSYYQNLTNQGVTINPADMERDIQTAHQNVLLQHQAEQQQTALTRQQEGQNAASDSAANAAAPQAGMVSMANNPGTTMQGRAALRGAKLQGQTPVSTPGTTPAAPANGVTVPGGTPQGTAPATTMPTATTVPTGTPGTATPSGSTTPSPTATTIPGAGGATTNPAQPTTDPTSIGMDAALAQISKTPEGALFAGQLAQLIKDRDSRLANDASNTNALLYGGNIEGAHVPGVEDPYNTMAARLKTVEDSYTQLYPHLQNLTDIIKQQNDTNIATQEKAAQDRLDWNTTLQTRQLSQQERNTHQAKIVQFALAGGFGEDAALNDVNASDHFFESKMRDVQTEMGVQNTELAAKFTGLYTQNNQTYLQSSIQNFKDMEANLERVQTAEGTNEIAKGQAEQGVLKDHLGIENAIRTDYANYTLGLVKDMSSMILSKSNLDRQMSWNAAINLVSQKQNARANLAQAIAASGGKPSPLIDEALGTMKDLGMDTSSYLSPSGTYNPIQTLAGQAQDFTQTQAKTAQWKDDVKTSVANLNADYAPNAVFKDASLSKGLFDSAYKLFNDAATPAAGLAAIRSQLSTQFSHAQNPSSLRVQDLGMTDAVKAQSLIEKGTATWQAIITGSTGLTKEGMDSLKTLMDASHEVFKQRAEDALSVEYVRLLTEAEPLSGHHTTIQDLTSDKELIKAFKPYSSVFKQPSGGGASASSSSK